jgi:hypothetical protein
MELSMKKSLFAPVCLIIALTFITALVLGDSEGEQGMSNSLIEKARWLVGSWSGEGMGGKCEEVWFPPVDGTMMCMFRFIKDGKIGFYEFITLSEEGDRLIKKLKHFNPDLTGWEEKDKTTEFEFISCSDTEIVFDGMTIRKTGDDTMEIVVKLKSSDGTVKDVPFSYSRMK